MLFLQIPLLAVLTGGDTEGDFQETISLKMIHSSSFYNHSGTQRCNSAWLGELQTHKWDSYSGSIIFLRPWSKGNVSEKDIEELKVFIHSFHNALPQVVNLVTQRIFEYPFELQTTMGCELHPGGAVEAFDRFAYQGLDLLYFQNDSWLPSPESGTTAQDVSRLFNQGHVTNKIIHRILSDTCPRLLLGLLDAGKADLQREVKPEAWLSTGPNPGPNRQMLVCHVSGFHPKPIWVKWMRGEEIIQGTQQSDILPNADETWYLQVTLDVEATETSGLYCRVRHSSLQGQDIILHLEHRPNSTGLIILAVMLPLVLLTGLAIWLRKRWSHCEPPPALLPWQ